MKATLGRWSDGPFVLALLACAALALGVFAFTTPSETVESQDTLYTQQGEFTYEAESTAPGLFDNGKATTGDPVFFRLSDTVAFAFDYRFTTNADHVIASTGSLIAEVGEAGGWKRTVALNEPLTFEGGEARLEGTLALADVRALMDAFLRETGVERAIFRLTVYPDIRSNADIAGEPVALEFAPRLLFAIDDAQIRLDPGNASDTASALQPADEASVATDVSVAAELSLLWFSVPVMAARVTAVVLLALALGGALLMAWARTSESGEHGPFGGREGVVPVRAGSLVVGQANRVELKSFADLAAIAESDGTVVFEEPSGRGAFIYSVCAHGNIYIWRSAPETIERASQAEAA